MKIACLVSQSTTMSISVNLWDSESCLIKSIDMDSQGLGGIGNCLSSP